MKTTLLQASFFCASLFMTLVWVGKLIEFYLRATLDKHGSIDSRLIFLVALLWAVFYVVYRI